MTPSSTTRVDMHCHSSASGASRLGVQRALGLPECATDPEEVYALAKRRGMDFVTITDHDTIAGVTEIADRPDVFLSEELTARFRGEAQAVHVLCYGITPDDHDWLQAHADDVERVAEHLHGNGIACALAHPFYAVSAPLTARHRRRLARLFPVWEVRNGSRAKELNQPAAIYIDTHGGVGIGGSDDHAGVDVGRTWSRTPVAATPQEFLSHVRSGRVTAGGDQGSAAKWAHSAMALAVRAMGGLEVDGEPDALVVMRMAERLMAEGDARSGTPGTDLRPRDAQALLQRWLGDLGLDVSDGGRRLLERMQADDFSHEDLYRRARRCHERKLRRAVEEAVTLVPGGGAWSLPASALGVFDACVPAIPYAAATTFLGREKLKLAARDAEPVRVALVADGTGAMHGVTHTIDEIRERGVPGFEVEVIGTDGNVDRRLSTVAEVEMPFYAGLEVGIPGLPAVVEALAEGRYGLLHLCSPGPAGVMAGLTGRTMNLPMAGSYHTELSAYAELRSGDPVLAEHMTAALSLFYGQCSTVLSPSAAADDRLLALGIDATRLGRWDRGVDASRFSPSLRDPELLASEGDEPCVKVLYAGRLTTEKGIALLAESFLAAHARDPRLHLFVAGGGPEEGLLRALLGPRVTFLGWLEGDRLAAAYASADIFLFCSRTDTFGQVLLEAQASGLPVVAVRAGGPAELIDDGRSGLLCPPSADTLADAVTWLAGSEAARRRLAAGGLAAARERSWDAALERLAAGWHRARRAPARRAA